LSAVSQGTHVLRNNLIYNSGFGGNSYNLHTGLLLAQGFNDDYVQMPLARVAQRAKRSVEWITDHVSRRSLPVRRHVSG
jgi:hypothetical protein